MTVKHWTQDPKILIDREYISQLNFWDSRYTTNEKSNALLRFSILLSIGTMSPTPLIIGGLLSYGLKQDETTRAATGTVESGGNIKTEFYNEKLVNCTKPTKDNPLMNFLISSKRDRTAACPNDDADIKKDIDEKMERDDLKQSVSDVWARKNQERQFYTAAVSTAAPDTKQFAEWLYGSPNTCKEGNAAQCAGDVYNDPRARPGALSVSTPA
jgi:hypothetical protein